MTEVNKNDSITVKGLRSIIYYYFADHLITDNKGENANEEVTIKIVDGKITNKVFNLVVDGNKCVYIGKAE